MTTTQRIDRHLDKLGIEPPPPKRRAVRKSKNYSELWPWYLNYRASNQNARITAEPDADGFFRVYARAA
jgi:hypothetical protein